jgi:hypothetical protein
MLCPSNASFLFLSGAPFQLLCVIGFAELPFANIKVSAPKPAFYFGSIMPRHVAIRELDLRNVHTITVADRMNSVPGFKTSAG